jgi:hypothetical protein
VLRTWAVVIAVGALAVAATVDAIRGGPEDASEAAKRASEREQSRGDELLSGPDSPLPGALPGRLVLTTAEGCRLRVVDLASVSLGELGPATTCALWASPAGGLAAIVTPHSFGEPGSGRFALVQLGDPPELATRLGELDGEPSWSPDGARLAWCTPAGETVVVTVSDGREERAVGCAPRFTPDGSLLTTDAEALNDRLLKDGDVELDALDLLRGFDATDSGDLDVLDYDEAPDGLLAISVLRLEPLGSRAVLQLWRDGDLQAGVQLPARYGNGPYRFGEFLRFSPSGTMLAIGAAARSDTIAFVDLRLRRSALEVGYQRAFAWSPDGSWLAVALADEIAVYGANSSEPVYRLPVRASAIAWVPS